MKKHDYLNLNKLVPYSDADFRNVTPEKKKTLKKANAVYELVKYLHEQNIISDDQFKIFCLRHGFNTMRLEATMSEISALLDLHVEVVLSEYTRTINLVRKNQLLIKIEKGI